MSYRHINRCIAHHVCGFHWSGFEVLYVESSKVSLLEGMLNYGLALLRGSGGVKAGNWHTHTHTHPLLILAQPALPTFQVLQPIVEWSWFSSWHATAIFHSPWGRLPRSFGMGAEVCSVPRLVSFVDLHLWRPSCGQAMSSEPEVSAAPNSQDSKAGAQLGSSAVSWWKLSWLRPRFPHIFHWKAQQGTAHSLGRTAHHRISCLVAQLCRCQGTGSCPFWYLIRLQQILRYLLVLPSPRCMLRSFSTNTVLKANER